MGKTKLGKYERFRGVRLKKKDRRAIDSMLSKGEWPSRVLRRARILQLLDERWVVSEIYRATGSYPATVRKIGYCYVEGGLGAALNERPRPGAQRLLDKRQETQVVAMICGGPPTGRARWSIRLAAEEASRRGIVATVGRETIRRTLLAHELKPWRKKNVVRSDSDAGVRRANGRRARVVREALQSE